MALASLFDKVEDNPYISIEHFQRRASRILNAYKDVYPEIEQYISVPTAELSREIYNIYLSTGYFYHTPRRIMPAAKKDGNFKNICLVRGAKLNRTVHMCGLGMYCNEDTFCNDICNILDMFKIPNISLKNYGDCLLNRATWTKLNYMDNVEYLITSGSFSRGYWTYKADTTGQVSLMRYIGQGKTMYFLYRCEDNIFYGYELPDWMVDNKQYRRIANAILSMRETLPPIRIKQDNELVYIQLGYLLPPEELNFLKLFSWPQSLYRQSCDFNRVMNKDVFVVFEKMLEVMGIRVEG
jgi:hypothetical protein